MIQSSRLTSVTSLVAVLATLLLAGCGRPGLDSERGPVGELALRLTIAPNVDVDVVNYRITGANILPIAGVINLDAGNAAPIVQLPAGSYTAEFEARSRDNAVMCRGVNMFQVLAGSTQQLAVTLDCRPNSSGSVSLGATFNNCPVITAREASPTSAALGTPITVTVTATDPDPGATLVYAWSAVGGGAFAAPDAASTTYSCGAVGAPRLEVTVSDGRCSSSAQIDVTCLPGPDACAACLAVFCEETPGCAGLTEPTRVPLCQTLLACIDRTQCRQGTSNLACLCGTAPAGQCSSEAGAANGPCLAEELAAAESTDLATISARFTNPTYASGAAHSYLSCRAESCAAECGP